MSDRLSGVDEGRGGVARRVPCNQAIQLLGDLLEGGLYPRTERDLLAHLDGCAACRLFLRQLELTRDLVGRLPDAAELSPRTQKLLVREFREFRAFLPVLDRGPG